MPFDKQMPPWKITIEEILHLLDKKTLPALSVQGLQPT